MTGIPESLAIHLPVIERALREALAGGPKELSQCARYVMGWENADGTPATGASGKRIRPALVMFGASLFSTETDQALPGAVAIELVHNFSLVHDEIQDHDMERHGRPTLFALHGTAQAINAGDYLYARAIEALTRAEVQAERRLLALDLLLTAVDRMIAGQWRDVSFESRMDVTPEEYLEMVAGKTGAMLAAPIAIGAVLAGASRDAAESLRSWGEKIGLAFQVQDDYLGIWGNPDQTGKSNTNDILRKKKTLPLIHGLSTSARVQIEAAFEAERPTMAQVDAVVSALNEAGSASFVREWGERLIASATAELEGMNLAPGARRGLEAVGHYIVNRDA